MMKKAPGLKTLCACEGIGIDVAKAELEVAGIAGETAWRLTLANDEASIEQFARTLSEGGYRHKVVCESTGHYHLLLGLVLARHGLDLRIINPLLSRKHQQARVRKTKTDGMDARVLAEMSITERALPAPANLSPQGVQIRLKQGQLHSLEKQLQGLTRSLSAYTETHAQLDLAMSPAQVRLQALVDELGAVKRQLHAEFEALLEAAADAEELASLRQVPGYSPAVAGLVGTVFDRGARGHRSWTAYVGLDVSVRQSGSWTGHGKLTKRGNSYLRKRLYCAAWGAMVNYPEVRRYYDRLKAGGRNHVEALCIIARKQLRIAHAILVKGRQYDPAIAFPA